MVLTDYTPGQRVIYERNPNHWNAEKFNLDRVEMPVITEYATGLAQLKAGGVYEYILRSEDILQTKQDVPALLLHQKLRFNGPSPYFTLFGYAEGSPFRDQRVRQAWSLSQDRDLFIDAIFNTSKFQASGIPLDSAWSTSAISADLAYHVDPRSKDFGPNAKYYTRDIAEAKKLLAAAGFANGVEVVGHTVGSGNPFGPNYSRQVEVQAGMPADAGIKVNYEPVDWTTEFIPRYRDGGGRYEGVAFTSIFVPAGSGRLGLFSVFNTSGGSFRGWSKSGRTFDGDPFLNDLTNKILAEFDNEKVKDLALELQKYESEYFYQPRIMGAAKTLDLSWPAISNWNMWDTGSITDSQFTTLWIDDTKPPLKPA
jgi:ABC-type transport system substrate-binding protein